MQWNSVLKTINRDIIQNCDKFYIPAEPHSDKMNGVWNIMTSSHLLQFCRGEGGCELCTESFDLNGISKYMQLPASNGMRRVQIEKELQRC